MSGELFNNLKSSLLTTIKCATKKSVYSFLIKCIGADIGQ